MEDYQINNPDHYEIYRKLIKELECKISNLKIEISTIKQKKQESEINGAKEYSKVESSLKKSIEAIRQRNFALENIKKEIFEKNLINKRKMESSEIIKMLLGASCWDDFCFELGNKVEEQLYPTHFDD